MNRRQLHEPETGARYYARVAAVLVFYGFTIAGAILTVLFMLGLARP